MNHVVRAVHRVLIVEDDAALRRAVARSIGLASSAVALEAESVAAAREWLSERPPPDLMIADVRLPDGSIFEVLDAVRELSPAPVVVAISGKASPDEAFRLAQRGVRAYLAKPFSIPDLAKAVETARRDAPDLEPLITAAVGHVPLRELQSEIRRVMVREALALTEGSRSGAARLLSVTRQAVQQMVQSRERSTDDAPARSSRAS